MPTLTSSSASAPASTATENSEVPSILTIEQIQALLPHRYPFLLVDRIIENHPGERAVGIKNVTVNEPFFQGHLDRKSTRLNSSHVSQSRMPSSA